MKLPSKMIWSRCTDSADLSGWLAVPVSSLASFDAEMTRLKVGWMCLKLFCRGFTCSASSSVEKTCDVNWASWGRKEHFNRTHDSRCLRQAWLEIRDLPETMRCRWGLQKGSKQPLENTAEWWGCRNTCNTDSCSLAADSSVQMAWLWQFGLGRGQKVIMRTVTNH